MKRIVALVLVIVTVLSFTSCGTVKIPQIANVDEDTAKTILASNSLIPAIKYENSEDVTKGCVIKTTPKIGSSVKKNSVVTLYISEGPELTVPDVFGIDEESAKNIISSSTLIPNIVYEYNYLTVEKGCVIYTSPSIGSKIKPNTQVTLYVSKGPSHINSTDSRISWWNVSSGQDNWEFYSPYIENEKLYIKCNNVTFAAKVKWQDRYNTGDLIGVASVNDTYDKSVPISAKYTKQEWAANESQSFTLEIPLSDLDVEKPTSMHIKLYADVNGNYKNIEISFTISW